MTSEEGSNAIEIHDHAATFCIAVLHQLALD